MIPFKLLAVMRPTIRAAPCGQPSGSLCTRRPFGSGSKMAPDTLARLFAHQPRRLMLAALLIVLMAFASSALSLLQIAPTRHDSGRNDVLDRPSASMFHPFEDSDGAPRAY